MTTQKSTNDVLKEVSLFKTLPPKELKQVKDLLKEKTFSKGEMIFMEGDSCDQIFILQSGRVKVFRTSSTGREQILEVLQTGDSCACNPGAECWHCSASAQAITNTKLWFLRRRDYVKLVESNHRFMHQLNQIFAQRLCRFTSLIEGVVLQDSYKRLVKFILETSLDSDAKDKAESIHFTHDEIAQRLGLVRETVSRHLSRLKKEKLITIHDRKILIQDRKQLKNKL